MSNVSPMKKAAAQEPGPALGFSLQVDLGQGRALVFQSHIDANASSAQLDALLDKAMHAADRQALRSKIIGWVNDIQEMEGKIASVKASHERAEQNYADTVTEYDRQIAEAQAQSDSIIQRAARNWQNSGRRGDFGIENLGNHDKAAVGQVEIQVREIMANKHKAAEERRIAKINLASSLSTFEAHISEAKRNIAAARAALGEGDVVA